MKVIIAACLLLFIAATQAPQAQTRSAPRAAGVKTSSTQRAGDAGGEEIGDDGVVRVNTNLVSIPVSVVDRDGRYLFDLKQEDFHIYEDGVEQQIAHFSSVEQPFTVVLLMDTSTSTVSYLDQIKAAAAAFISQLRPGDSVLPVTFDGAMHPLLYERTSERAMLLAALDKMHSDAANNGTRLYDAVDLGSQTLKRIRGRKALLLFTDGEDTWSKATLKSTLRDATELDALIYTIHYGSSPATDYLVSLSEKTGGRFYQATDTEMLKQAFSNVAEELRRQYSLGYYPKKSVRRGEERKIKIKVDRAAVGIRTRKSYLSSTIN